MILGFIKLTGKGSNDRLLINVHEIKRIEECNDTKTVFVIVKTLLHKTRETILVVTEPFDIVMQRINEAVVRL